MPVYRKRFSALARFLCTTSHETGSFARILLPNERGNTWHTGENHIHQRRNSIPSQAGQSARRCGRARVYREARVRVAWTGCGQRVYQRSVRP
jgi:hypothetical protein